VLTAGNARATIYTLTANLNGAQESPSTASTGTATCTVTLDNATGQVSISGIYQGLMGNAIVAHLHGPAPAGMNAAVILGLSQTGGTSGEISGSGTLTSAQVQDMLNGLTYINVHTTVFPGGEIRGQVHATVHTFTLSLNGAQEVPPTTSQGTGTCTVTLNGATGQVSISGSYQGLMATAIAAHLHGPAPPGMNASVMLSLSQTGGTSGMISGSTTLTALQVQNMLNELTYINVHTTFFPGGEIRGQIQNPPGEASNAHYMRARKGVGSAVNLTYAPSCGATNHVAYWGLAGPGPITAPLAWTNSACSLGVNGSASFDPGPTPTSMLVYFIVAGQTGAKEGSYGRASNGSERPEASGVGLCDRPQALNANCP